MKSLSVATIDEFYLRFDGDTCKEPAAKLTLTLNFKIISFASCSTHHEGITFPRNRRSQLNSSLEKMTEEFFNTADAHL